MKSLNSTNYLKVKKLLYLLTDPVVNRFGSFVSLIFLQSVFSIMYVLSMYHGWPITGAGIAANCVEIVFFSYVIAYVLLLIRGVSRRCGGVNIYIGY
jgi:hypothetical protein